MGPVSKEARMRIGDLVCYKGNRTSLGTIIEIDSKQYQKEAVSVATVHWVTGLSKGKTNSFDLRDLVLVKD